PIFFSLVRRPPIPTLFPYTTLFRSAPIAKLSEYLGIKTNNFAEYSALLAALEYAIANGHRALKVISDSELMVRQMTGQYKVNSPDRKSTRLNSSHSQISYAVFCLKK